jgi:hypothetical protein
MDNEFKIISNSLNTPLRVPVYDPFRGTTHKVDFTDFVTVDGGGEPAEISLFRTKIMFIGNIKKIVDVANVLYYDVFRPINIVSHQNIKQPIIWRYNRNFMDIFMDIMSGGISI